MVFLAGSIERLRHVQLPSRYSLLQHCPGRPSMPQNKPHALMSYTRISTCSPHTMKTLLWWDATLSKVQHVPWMGRNMLVSSSTTFGDSSSNVLRVDILCFHLLLQVFVVISKKRPRAQVELHKFMICRHDLQVGSAGELSSGTHWPGPKRCSGRQRGKIH